MTGPSTNHKKNKAVTTNKPPEVWGSGPVKIFDVELDCYILEDGLPDSSR